MGPMAIVFANVTAPSQMTFHQTTFFLRNALESIVMKTGLIRRYYLRYQTTNYQNGWQGDGEKIWVIVLDERYKDKFALTNGYTDNRALEVTG